MRGIASRRPDPHAARAMIGGQMLLLIQSLLVIRSGGEIATLLWIVIGLTTSAAIGAFALALVGEPSRPCVKATDARLQRRHGNAR